MPDKEMQVRSPLNLDGYGDVLVPSEVGEIMRVDPKTVVRWCNQGKLESFRTVGGHRRIPKEAFIKALTEAQHYEWEDESSIEYKRRTGVGRPGNVRTRPVEQDPAGTGTEDHRPPRRKRTKRLVVVDPS